MAKVDKYFLGSNNNNFCITDKETNVNNHIKYMLNRSNIMFQYEGLPDTIPQDELELLLQTNGFAIVTKIDNELYAVNGGLGGEGDVYNNPTVATVSIPCKNYNKTLTINEDCIVISNDTMQIGLIPMYQKYCTLLNENEITMFLADVNKRVQNLLSANDDNTVQSAKKFLSDVLDGKLGVIAESKLFDSLKVNSATTTGSVSLTDLFEYEQYLKASLFNEIGLSANFNMKRERLTSAEVESNTDNLYPLVDNMLGNRRKAIKKINEMFGTNITVEFNSSWDYRIKQGEPITAGEDLETENVDNVDNIVDNNVSRETSTEETEETPAEETTEETEEETTEETEEETTEETAEETEETEEPAEETEDTEEPAEETEEPAEETEDTEEPAEEETEEETDNDKKKNDKDLH